MALVIDGVVIVKTRKEELQKVLADLPHGALGRQVVQVAAVQTAGVLVGGQEFRHRFLQHFTGPDGIATRLARWDADGRVPFKQ